MPTPLLTGLVAAPFTPFLSDGRLNLELIPALCDHLLAHRVSAAFVCGSTGEGTSLTDAERRQVTAAWVHAARGRLKVVVHIGHLSASCARELAAHAQEVGADAISSCAPSFFPIQSIEQLVSVTAESAAGAPDLPFYFYHIPALTRMELSMVDYLHRAGPAIPSLRGVKFTHADFEEPLRLITYQNGHYEILGGREQMLLAALATGARGAIGSNFNFAAPLYHEIWSSFQNNDLPRARRLQGQAIELTLFFRRFGGLRAMKAVMAFLGLDCGPVRAPLKPLTLSEKKELEIGWQQLAQSTPTLSMPTE